MTSYYLSYGEPPMRRFPWRLLSAIAAILLLISAVIGIIWFALSGSSDAADAPSTEEAVPFAQAVSAVYASDTNTIYLVDVSGSITEAEHLEDIKFALSSLGLPDRGPRVENSQAALMSFAGDSEPEIVIEPVMLDESEAQLDWLVRVDGLEAALTGGSFIYDAMDSVRRDFPATAGDGRSNVIVLISDGIDGGTATEQCRPALSSDNPEYCISDSGDPIACDKVEQPSSGDTLICKINPSSVNPGVLLQSLVEGDFTVHTIAYGSPQDHVWLEQVAEATGGTYTVGGD